jgi:hypothetical protein
VIFLITSSYLLSDVDFVCRLLRDILQLGLELKWLAFKDREYPELCLKHISYLAVNTLFQL